MHFVRPWLAAVVALSAPAWAQDSADAGTAGPLVEPRAVNPGTADAPAELIRTPALEPAPAPALTAAVAAHPEAAAPEARAEEITAALSAAFRTSYQGTTAFPLDSERTLGHVAPLQTRLRVGPEIHYGNVGLIAEADAATGALLGTPSATLVGERVTYPGLQSLELRKFYVEYKWATGAFRAGQQVSDWGLGLLANSGARDPEAGDFGQQVYGTLAYRALLAFRPFYAIGGKWRAIELALAGDLVVRDATAIFDRGDRAFQAVVAARFVKDADNNFGLYGVYRNQRNIAYADPTRRTEAWVLDGALKWDVVKKRRAHLKVGVEAVGLGGQSGLYPNDLAPVQTIRQFGAAARSSLRIGNTTFYFDGGFASGDQNPNDDRLEAFRFDRDYKVGLVLFDQVLAYQSARGSVRAADTNLVGVAPDGVTQLGTGGAVTGAWYLFPRVKIALSDWLDGYGGPLFAFSSAKLTDPFESRLAGGSSRNYLGGTPGAYLGTELDVGVQARVKPVKELTLTITGEGGFFVPGSAFATPGGGVMGPVMLGRLRVGAAI